MDFLGSLLLLPACDDGVPRHIPVWISVTEEVQHPVDIHWLGKEEELAFVGLDRDDAAHIFGQVQYPTIRFNAIPHDIEEAAIQKVRHFPSSDRFCPFLVLIHKQTCKPMTESDSVATDALERIFFVENVNLFFYVRPFLFFNNAS